MRRNRDNDIDLPQMNWDVNNYVMSLQEKLEKWGFLISDIFSLINLAEMTFG